VAVASAGPYANHLHLAPDRQPCQYLTTQFLQAGCSSCHPTNSIKAMKYVFLNAETSSYITSYFSEVSYPMLSSACVYLGLFESCVSGQSSRSSSVAESRSVVSFQLLSFQLCVMIDASGQRVCDFLVSSLSSKISLRD